MRYFGTACMFLLTGGVAAYNYVDQSRQLVLPFMDRWAGPSAVAQGKATVWVMLSLATLVLVINVWQASRAKTNR